MSLFWGPTQRRQAFQPTGRTPGTNRRAGAGKAEAPLRKCIGAGLPTDRTDSFALDAVLQLHSPTQAGQTPQPHSFHEQHGVGSRTVTSWKRLNLAKLRWSRCVGCGLGGARVATTGDNTNSTTEAAQTSAVSRTVLQLQQPHSHLSKHFDSATLCHNPALHLG